MSLFDETNVTPKFEDFVGEGKKYKSNDDVAKALIEKDRFIERLKTEAEEARQVLSTRPLVDRSQEILDRIEALKVEPVTERPVVTPTPERTEVKGLSLDDIERVLNEREQKKIAQGNIDKVKAALSEKYGDQWRTQLKSTAEKLNVNASFLENTAAQSPEAFFRLIGDVQTQETLFTPPASSVTIGFTPTAGTARNEDYYKKLKASDPKKYLSAEIRNQQYKDMMSLKEAYYT